MPKGLFFVFFMFITILSSGQEELKTTITTFNVQSDSQEFVYEWTAANNKNTQYFILEHSSNGILFTDLARQKSEQDLLHAMYLQPVSRELTHYGNKHFFRIAIVDGDGISSYSEVVPLQDSELNERLEFANNETIKLQTLTPLGLDL